MENRFLLDTNIMLDLLLAATAITHDLALVTQDRKHFEGIGGLRLGWGLVEWGDDRV